MLPFLRLLTHFLAKKARSVRAFFFNSSSRSRQNLSGLFIGLALGAMAPAYAQYPTLQFISYASANETGADYTVGSPEAVCQQLKWPGFKNPRLDPAYYSNGEGPEVPIPCFYDSPYGSPDARGAGKASCGNPYTTTFVVDVGAGSCRCRAGFKYSADAGKCIETPKVSGQPGGPSQNGPSCSGAPGPCPSQPEKQPEQGEPIDPSSGNMWHIEKDYTVASPLSRLALMRTYNSSVMNPDANVARSFGVRWTQPYDIKLEAHSETIVAEPNCSRFVDTQIVVCDWYPLAKGVLPKSASIVRSDGKRTMFNSIGGAWVTVGKTSDRLTSTLSTDGKAIAAWLYTAAAGDRQERFSGDGRLLSITERNGAVQKFTYASGTNNDSSVERLPADAPVCSNVQAGLPVPAGSLLCVTDQSGRQLQFEYSATGQIIKALDPAGQPYLYEYDGPSGGCPTFDPANRACVAKNLTKVTYPDGKSRVYFYNEKPNVYYGLNCTNTKPVAAGLGHLISSMTGLQDENGARHITWIYNCMGQAVVSMRAGGVEKVQIGYGNGVQYVRHTVGPADAPVSVQRTFTPVTVNGVHYNASIGGQCVGCGSYAARYYDAVGNVTSAKDWNGNLICMRYDSLNRKIATIEGGGVASCSTLFTATSLTSPARKTSTVWHETFNMPKMLAEPLRITTYEYDGSGNLLSKKVQPTADATGVLGVNAAAVGAARLEKFSYNAAGQIKTVASPRPEVTGVTSYDYDVDGNMTHVTNAAAHVTQLSNYDVHGRPGRITDPNGLVTNLIYNDRGWLTSSSVGGEETVYTYDGVGQVKTVSKAGMPTITYTYDDAHRLTGIADSQFNSITYTLDLTGNRVREQVKDPDGVLSRQVTRVYDVLNQLQKVTGAQQ